LPFFNSKPTFGSSSYTYNGVQTTNPLFQKPQKDIIIIMIRILQLPYCTVPQFPFRKRGEKVPLFLVSLWGQERQSPPSKLQVPEKYVSQNYSISVIEITLYFKYCFCSRFTGLEASCTVDGRQPL
jgi:hypothetical protein